jgi:cytoskeletal protein CcmA (bactofilin family)
MFQKSSAPPKEEEKRFGTPEDAVETIVGPSVVVEGDFSSEGNIIVKGTVSGSVHTSKLLRVEEGAKIFANVKAGNAIVAGTIRGNAKIADRLELSGTARIAGDVECSVLIVEAGALIHGKVSMVGMEGEEGRNDKKINFGRMKSKLAEREEPVAV